jgi:heme exporter protein D
VTWVAVALAVVAAALAVALGFVVVALTRTLRSLQSVIDDLNREARPLLADLQGDARKASAGLDRVGDLVGAAESVTRRVDGASKLAYVTFSNPVVKVLAVGHGVSRVGRRLRGRPEPGGRGRRNGNNGKV